MQDKNRFPFQHMYFVVSVYKQQGHMFDGICTVLQNPDNPGEMI